MNMQFITNFSISQIPLYYLSFYVGILMSPHTGDDSMITAILVHDLRYGICRIARIVHSLCHDASRLT